MRASIVTKGLKQIGKRGRLRHCTFRNVFLTTKGGLDVTDGYMHKITMSNRNNQSLNSDTQSI